MSEIEKLAVIGGGAWGTALAQVAATGGRETLLWAMEDDVVTAINKIHENPVYLKGIKLDKAIRATSNFSDLSKVDAWLVVTPAQHMRAVLSRSPCPEMPLILCSKGIEDSSGKMLHDVARDVCPTSPVAVLSGLGDLVLTCSSTASRNFSLGKAIGEGRDAATLMADRRTVAEGATTAPVLKRVADERGIDMPIVTAVDALLNGQDSVENILEALMARPPRLEAH